MHVHALISSLPRLIVEGASPVIFDTTARPPQPAVRTYPAANNRRSSKLRADRFPSLPNRVLVDHTTDLPYACSPRTGIPDTRVTPTLNADRDSIIVRSALSGRFIPLLAVPDHFVQSDFARAGEGLLTTTVRRFPAGSDPSGSGEVKLIWSAEPT
jgi:hypothetical protein